MNVMVPAWGSFIILWIKFSHGSIRWKRSLGPTGSSSPLVVLGERLRNKRPDHLPDRWVRILRKSLGEGEPSHFWGLQLFGDVKSFVAFRWARVTLWSKISLIPSIPLGMEG